MAGTGSMNKANQRQASKSARGLRAGSKGKIITERNKIRRLFRHLSLHPGDKSGVKAFVKFGGNVNKLRGN